MNLRISLVPAILLVAACAGTPEGSPDAQQPTLAASTASTTAAGPEDPSLVRADKARMKGAENAKVWFIMSSDFQCPFCREFHEDTWKRIEKDYVAPGKIRVAFLNHPMQFHQFAIPSAEAAMCAGKQDKFWQMHDGLFATQEKWAKGGAPMPIYDSLATSLGLGMTEWRQCMSAQETRALVESDLARSKAGGVQGTPSFFIGGKLAVVGLAPYADFRKAIDEAIAQAARQP